MPTEEKPGDDKNKVHRLVDLMVHEVSLVDRGANRHKWLIRKREDDMAKGKRVKVGNNGELTTNKGDAFGVDDALGNTGDNADDDANRDDAEKTVKIAKASKESVSTVSSSAKEAIGVIGDAVKSAEENEDKGTVIPAIVSGPIGNVTSSILNLVTEHPTQKSVSLDVAVVEKEADGKTTYQVKGVDTEVSFGEYDSKDEATKRADAVAAFKPTVTKQDASEDKAARARKLLWMVMDKINDGAFMDDSEKTLVDSMLGMLKEAVAKQQAEEELSQIVMSPAAKTDITETLKKVSESLDAFMADIEKAEETEDDLPAPMPDDLGLELAKIAHSMVDLVTKYSTPEDGKDEGTEEDDVAKLLASVIGKLNSEKSDEAPVIALLDKAVGLLGGSQESDDNKGDGQSQSNEEPVDKRGAKLSAVRRGKFREAMKILSELFSELVPDAEKGTWPHRNTAKSAKTKINKAEEQVLELEKRQQEIEAKIEKSETELRKVRKELAKEMKRAQPSNAAWVEKVPDAEDFDQVDKNDEVSWPSDMNSPNEW